MNASVLVTTQGTLDGVKHYFFHRLDQERSIPAHPKLREVATIVRRWKTRANVGKVRMKLHVCVYVYTYPHYVYACMYVFNVCMFVCVDGFTVVRLYECW